MTQIAEKTKVAHITTVDASLRYLLLNQLKALQAAGYDVVGISSPGEHAEALSKAGIRHIPVRLTRRVTPFADLIALWKLAGVLRGEKFAIVHTHTPKAALIGQYAALLAGVRIRVHTIHGLYLPETRWGWQRALFNLLERITMRWSHLNLSQNKEDVAYAIRHRITHRDKIRFLGNGIDLSRFDPKLYPASRRELIRKSLGFSPEHTVIGIVARFVAEKGYRELIEAAKRIRKAAPEARFLFIGEVDAEKPDALSPNLLLEDNLQEVVSFLGHRDDIADLIAAMDIFVLPSYREGMPRSLMEASAMGRASVATNIRGSREVVDHQSTGLLVKARSSHALAEAILLLISNVGLRQRLGAAAREKAIADFDERRAYNSVVSAYDELLRVNRERS
jgi:glycosyltransferase involved in cell wall biosynthesis